MYKLVITIILLATLNYLKVEGVVEKYEIENTALLVDSTDIKPDESSAPDDDNAKQAINGNDENNDIADNGDDDKDENEEGDETEGSGDGEKDEEKENEDEDLPLPKDLLLRGGSLYVKSDIRPTSDQDTESQEDNQVDSHKDEDNDRDAANDEEGEESGEVEEKAEEKEAEESEVQDNNNNLKAGNEIVEVIIDSPKPVESTQPTLFFILAISSCILLFISLGCLVAAIAKKLFAHPPSKALVLRKGSFSENV